MLKLKHSEVSILYPDCKRSFNYNVFAISVSFLYHVTRRRKWNSLGLPAACAHLLTFSFSCNVYGPLMLLSHTLQRPTQRLHVSVTLSALIRRSRRETVESRGVLFFSSAALLFAVIRDTNKPLCLLIYTIPVSLRRCLWWLLIFSRLSWWHAHTHIFQIVTVSVLHLWHET